MYRFEEEADAYPTSWRGFTATEAPHENEGGSPTGHTEVAPAQHGSA